MNSIVYLGRFKDLIPKGFIFQKLYAKNYRTYRKEFKNDNTLWIWQKDRNVEINDFYSHSAWFLDKIIKGEYKNWAVTPNYYTYKIKYDRTYSFNQDIVDYLLQMHLDSLIKIEDM